MKPLVETLEGRDLPAVTLVNGVLLVQGTIGSDKFVFTDNGSQITVKGLTFDKSQVQKIEVDGKGGYDIIRYEMPNTYQRMLMYDLFDPAEQYTARMRLNSLSVAIGVNRTDVADAYFTFRTEHAGRMQGGYIMDVGDPRVMTEPTPGPDEDGDVDDYAEIAKSHEEDRSNQGRLAKKNLPPEQVAFKLDKNLLKAKKKW